MAALEEFLHIILLHPGASRVFNYDVKHIEASSQARRILSPTVSANDFTINLYN